jgi:hypothetical protein
MLHGKLKNNRKFTRQLTEPVSARGPHSEEPAQLYVIFRQLWRCLVTSLLASCHWGNNIISMQSQWIFPISALQLTPSVVTSSYTVAKELYDRSRGVEFLFRLGSSLGLLALCLLLPLDLLFTHVLSRRPTSAMFTAATWFHRFFMRYSMEDYHRQVFFISQFSDDADDVSSRTLQLPAYSLQPKRRNVGANFATLQECARLRLQGKMFRSYTARVQHVSYFCCSN